jgi:VanZ family protein
MTLKLKNYISYQLPWHFIMLAIFIQSSTGKINIPDFGIDWFDKVLHFIAFGLLGLLTAHGLKHAGNRFLQKNYLWSSLLICIIFGATDEIHQLYIPGRYASIYDWIADILGILLFVSIYRLWQRKYKA